MARKARKLKLSEVASWLCGPLADVEQSSIPRDNNGLFDPEIVYEMRDRERAAAFLNVSQSSFDRLDIPRVKIGRRVWFLKADLESHISGVATNG